MSKSLFLSSACACLTHARVPRHFQCTYMDLGKLEISVDTGDMRGWSATPEGTIVNKAHPKVGADVLLMNHVRRRATQPSIVVYYPADEKVDVVARADIEITSRFEFVWSKHTRLMTVSFACYPIHGQDYSVMIGNPNEVFETLPATLGSGKVLDWLRGRANQGITVSDLHDISTMEMPIPGDEEGSALFLAFATTSMSALSKITSYLDKNVHPLDSGRSRQGITTYSVCVSVCSVYLCFVSILCNLDHVAAQSGNFSKQDFAVATP